MHLNNSQPASQFLLITNFSVLVREICRYLIRGDADENYSNFMQLLKLCGESDIKLQEWMIKGRDKYLCHEAQNEMLKIMALKVLKDIGLCLYKSPFYTIMADETFPI